MTHLVCIHVSLSTVFVQKHYLTGGHSNTITCARISHNGLDICTTSMDKSALVWDVRMLRILLKLQ